MIGPVGGFFYLKFEIENHNILRAITKRNRETNRCSSGYGVEL